MTNVYNMPCKISWLPLFVNLICRARRAWATHSPPPIGQIIHQGLRLGPDLLFGDLRPRARNGHRREVRAVRRQRDHFRQRDRIILGELVGDLAVDIAAPARSAADVAPGWAAGTVSGGDTTGTGGSDASCIWRSRGAGTQVPAGAAGPERQALPAQARDQPAEGGGMAPVGATGSAFGKEAARRRRGPG